MLRLVRFTHSLFGTLYHVDLRRAAGHIELSASRGQKPVPLHTALRSSGVALPGSINTGFTSLRLPLEHLEVVRHILCGVSNEAMDVRIDPSVASLRRVEPPHDFQIRYAWSDPERAVVRTISPECAYFGNGWFVAGNLYWNVPSIFVADDEWLMRERFESGEAIRLLATDVADCWTERGAPIAVVPKISSNPAFEVNFREVTAEEMILEIRWRVAPEKTSDFQLFPKHVLCEETVCPGVPASNLPEFMRRTRAVRLRGQTLASFKSEVWPAITDWAVGKTGPFQELHKIIGQDVELLLNVRQTVVRGVGAVTAVPRIRVGRMHIDAERLSRRISPKEPHLRTPDGWLPIQALKQVHLGFLGRFDDGSPIVAFDLTPVEILTRSSTRFRGPWTRVVLPSINLPEAGSIADVGLKHLDFLRSWGIPGGVLGPLADVARALQQSLSKLTTAHPDARVLVVGSKRALDSSGLGGEAKRRFDGVKSDPPFSAHILGVILATPKALDCIPGLLHLDWTMICLLEADTLIKSAGSALFANLVSSRSRLVIGHFTGKDFLKRPAVRDAMGKVFGINSPLIWDYALRDPLATPPKLPDDSFLKGQEHREEVRPAQFNLKDSEAQGAVPVPARQTLTGVSEAPRPQATRPSDLGIQVRVRFSSGYDSFVDQARKLVAHSEADAPFVPFMCYWPTYDSMTSAQRRWYFYWRDQVRNRRFPSTDLSYIFVHIYELINGIGWREAREGYEQLRRLWIAYRGSYSKLDDYLIDWTSDFLALNPCGIDPLEPIRHAMELGSRHLDADTLLSEHLGKSLDSVPLSLWESLSNYRITQSKFYLSGNEELLESYCPKGMDRIDRFLAARSGGGIFENFKPRAVARPNRTAFQGAVYAGPCSTIDLPPVLPYSHHSPLRDLVTSSLKHAENRLREIRSYKGKLRGYQLDPDIQKVIDDFIETSRNVILPPPPKPKVEIDLRLVEDLKRKSDDIREVLQRPAEEVRTILPAAIPDSKTESLPASVVRPEGTPDHLLTDLPGIYWLLKNLDATEFNLITALVRNDFAKSDRDLLMEFSGVLLEPIIDRINQLAIELAGDVLIVDEDGGKLIVDDFQDELQYLIRQGMFSQTETRPKTLPGDLPEEWVNLGLQLSEIHWLALRSIFSAESARAFITELAREHGTMPETLIDQINDLALTMIGDVIIEPGSDPPVIEDEDKEFVARLLTHNEELLKCPK